VGPRRPVRADGGVPLRGLPLSRVTITQQGIDIAAAPTQLHLFFCAFLLLHFFMFLFVSGFPIVMLNIFINHLRASLRNCLSSFSSHSLASLVR
jgi:hypothetical protein